MALAENLLNSLQGTLVDALQKTGQEYMLKFQQQEQKIKQLQNRVNELEQYAQESGTIEDGKENIEFNNLDRFKSEDIDNILDEIEQIDDTKDNEDDDNEDDDDVCNVIYVSLFP